jgi:hypothetical protein
MSSSAQTWCLVKYLLRSFIHWYWGGGDGGGRGGASCEQRGLPNFNSSRLSEEEHLSHVGRVVLLN